ncbi:copper resistance CopC family protein [Actinoalloteichus hymeniacidonis]|uniref:CopC domain-containing protein n=1 Tax=Actinoalloteichus hymeniacidonis TaxID=340345 RepID=A0AAC9HMV2_9PSEU|nr:copper resistance CopC family protein [Actinoalloteichus hymeniacidonis]AOS62077.1 hypothetical protein TL08_06260 [Actinoalloteichus hymeniacidonis]MBB5909901.1 hypothetical protein [Actinoalloteichus hymeniacidonis]
MRTFRMLGAAFIASAVLVLGTALPASAHDELISSNPTDGQQLDAAPEVVSLSFSADVLTIGAAIIVVDESGTDWVTGEPEVRDGAVTAELEPGLAEAGYEIRWRVVSSDGHPISGIIPFTIGDGQPLSRAAMATNVEQQGQDQDQEAQSTQETEGNLRVPLIGAAGAVTSAALFALVHFLRRRTRDGASDDSPQTGVGN